MLWNCFHWANENWIQIWSTLVSLGQEFCGNACLTLLYETLARSLLHCCTKFLVKTFWITQVLWIFFIKSEPNILYNVIIDTFLFENFIWSLNACNQPSKCDSQKTVVQKNNYLSHVCFSRGLQLIRKTKKRRHITIVMPCILIHRNSLRNCC